MKKYISIFVSIICMLLMAGCASGTETMYQNGIVVDGVFYEKSAQPMPAEIDESAIIGYVESYTDTFPEKDGETNISKDLIGEPYAKVEGGIAILYQNEWYLCKSDEDKLPEESSVEKANQDILPQEPTSIEVSFDINPKEPAYLLEDADAMQKIYKILQVDTWQETGCEWEITGSEYINVYENEKRYIIEILGVDEETVLFKVTDEQNQGTSDATKYYSGITESYSDLVEQLQKLCAWPNAYESHIYLANLDDADDFERIYIVNKSSDNSYYHAYVENSRYEEIWSQDFGTAHVGEGALFLCTIDEKEYLLEYSPYANQGMASYRYFLIDFQNDKRNVVAEKEVEFIFYTQDNVEERIAFMDEVNALIEQSQVIVSTLGGKAVVRLASAEEFKMTEEQLYYYDTK